MKNYFLSALIFILLNPEIYPQKQSYITTNKNINKSLLTRSIYNITTFNPLKKNSSAGVLDSLIYIRTNGNRNRIVYNYNDDLSLNYFINADWYNGEWIDYEKHTNTYNAAGNLESVLWELFNSTTKEWHQTEEDIFNYDSLGNRIFSLHQFFNGQEFVNDFKYENSYDAANNLVSSVNQDWIDSIWVNTSKTINTYTPQKVNDTTLFQVWTNDQWINYYLTNYEYDENHNTIVILTKTWQGNKWADAAKGVFEYGDNNNCIIEDWMIANDTNNWENWFRIFYEYDDNNNLIHLYGEEWENNHWIPESEPLKVTNPDGILFGYLVKEIFLYYSKPTSVESEKSIDDGFNLLQNYPNPFNPSTTLSFVIGHSSFVALKVYDVIGKEVATLVNEEKPAGSYEVTWNAANLSSGVYFYQLKAGSYTATKKLLLLK